MLTAGLRLLLAVAAPLLGAAVAHELRGHRRAALAVAVAAIAACTALTLSLAAAVSVGGSLERSFGFALPGVALTARADAATVTVMLIACLATALAVPRHSGDAERLAGMLLCLSGAGLVAAAGNLVLVGGGVEVVAAGTLLLRGRSGPGARSTVIVSALLGGAGLALLASAAELVAEAGTSDLAFVPQAAINAAIAVPWASAGAALLVAPAILGQGGWPDRDWAAIAALPAGFLVLLRLQVSAAGQVPTAATVVLATVGALVAVLAAVTGRRTPTVAAAGRTVVAVLAGATVGLFSGALADSGTVLAGLFVALELALFAAPSWNRLPTAWAAASVALAALPGGFAFAVVVVGLGAVARRGAAWFPLLVALGAAVAVAAVVAARAVLAPLRGGRPLLPGAALAVAAGLGGGLLPGTALRLVAGPLGGGATPADVDSASLGLPGGGFAGGYLVVAAVALLSGVVAAMVVAGDAPLAAQATAVPRPALPRLAALLRMRRVTAGPLDAVAASLHRLDGWLEAQPGVAFLAAVAVLAILLIH